ncbi:MAG: hypothetical protein J5546_10245 [Lachnospiraceae bacterium]|nr:hypothetical protein [Lachnospiraceae bacterium]
MSKKKTHDEFVSEMLVINPDILVIGHYNGTKEMLSDVPREKLKEIIKGHAVNGVVDLPKEYGMFIAKGYSLQGRSFTR